jgi:hypothetical protein
MKARFIVICSAIAAVVFTSCTKEPLPGTNLPVVIKAYITTHFQEHFITEAKENAGDSTNTYEIMLDNLTKLEFSYKYEITDIDGITKIPDSVISAKILAYVNINYPDNFITGWELDEGKQEVELDNALDLEFDSNSDFLQIDITP